MGVSEVLLCPYRCLEYKMVRLEKLKIHGSTPSPPSPPLSFNFDDRNISITTFKLSILAYFGVNE